MTNQHYLHRWHRAFLGAALLWTPLLTRAATITWDGGGDGVNWSDPLNWSGNSVPTASDDAVLGSGATISLNGGFSVRSVQGTRGLTIVSGSLTVLGGTSALNGPLTIAQQAALAAEGLSTTLTATNVVTADGAWFTASGGAKLRVPGLRNYSKPNGCYDVLFQATGAGSLLDLGGLTNLYGGDCNWLRIQAQTGGSVNLSNLVAVSDGWLQAYADGAGSLVDLRNLGSFPSPDRWLSLEANNGGRVLSPLLLGSPRLGIGVSNGGSLSTNQLTRIGGVTVGGMALTLPAVTNVDAANLVVSAGGSLALPLVRQVAKAEGCYNVNWTASGAGAYLNLSAVTNFSGGNCAWQYIQSSGGGIINLSNVVTISDGWVQAYADGAGSLVDLRKLVSFPSTDRWLSLEAYNGGQVLSPLFPGNSRVGIGLSNGGLLSTNQLTRIGGVTLAGMALTLPALTNIDGANLTVNAGGSLAFPLVFRVTKPDGCYNVNWTASGAGAYLNLSKVTNFYGGNCAWQYIQANGGGAVNLSNVVTLSDGYVQASADGAGSLVDLRKLVSFPSTDRWLSLEAYNGGQVLTPLLAGGPRVGLGLGNGGQLNTTQITRVGGVTLSSASLTLAGVTNADGVGLTANAGGSLSFPNVRRLSKPDGCYDVNWQASGAGALIDFSGVTNLYGGNCGWLRFQSYGGGRILLSNVVAITDGQVIASADGAGSLVDLRKLTNFPSLDRWLSLEAYNGGEVNTALFAGGPRVGATAGSGGLLSTNQFRRLGGIAVQSMALTLPAVTNLDGAGCSVSGGGSLAVPLVRRLNKPEGCYDMNWQAYGAGSFINLASVTNAYGGNCGWLRFQTWAGGHITLSNLVALTNGQIIMRSEDAGSVVDVRKLASFPATDRWLSLEVVNGGQLICSNFTGGARVGLTVSGGGVLPTGQFKRLGGISAAGTALSLAGLTNLDSAGVSASAGGTVSLPALLSLTKTAGCYDMNWNADGPGSRIDAPGLQSVSTAEACGWLRLWARNGGTLNFSNAVSLSGPTIEVLADGSGSVLDLSHLGSFVSALPYLSTLTAQNGGVILLGTQAFLLANVSITIPPGNPVLPPVFISDSNMTLYGTPWRSYLVEQRSASSPTNAWRFFQRVPLTNSFQAIAGPPPKDTAFRVTEFVADPPILDLGRVPTNKVQLVLYGPAGKSYQLLTHTNVNPGATWANLTAVSLTNSFRIVAPMSVTNSVRFYRAKQL